MVLIHGDKHFTTSDPVGGEYGYRVRRVVDRFVPRVWSFSTKPEFTPCRKAVRRNLFVERIEGPKTDVLKKMDNAVIMVQRPEVKKEDIHWEVSSDIISICAQNKLRPKKYIRELLLPFAANEESIRMRYREGIFEITLRRKQKEKAK